VLYDTAIAHCAEKLALRARHVGSVTLIHETIHALAHLGRDLDGRMWPEFSLPAADGPLFEPSWFHETLTQYFAYHHIVRLRDPALLHAFEAMSNKQTPEHRAWQRLQGMPHGGRAKLVHECSPWRWCGGTIGPPHLRRHAGRRSIDKEVDDLNLGRRPLHRSLGRGRRQEARTRPASCRWNTANCCPPAPSTTSRRMRIACACIADLA